MDEPVRPGDILAQKYRVDKVLGVGGMGVVVAATHLQLDQKVALKFMLNGFSTGDALARFHREARIAVKLRSEHVARVSDTGTLENGSPYIVMEYLEGCDIGAQLTQHGPMPVGFAAECIVQACDAVGEAHAHGIVHRDLKPANLFLTQHADGSPLVKVLDFGISKAAAGPEGDGLGMTKTGAIMGSPLYMSPEQMRSLKMVDARTDVWALGVILYEMLTAKTPFDAENYGDLLVQVMTLPHTPLRTLRPDVPAEISDLVDRCLSKDLAARLGSVAELAEGLAPFCAANGVVIAQRIVTLARRAGTTGGRLTGPAGWGATARHDTNASKTPWVAIGGACAVLLLIGGVVVRVGIHRDAAVAPADVPPPAQSAAPSAPSSTPTSAAAAPATGSTAPTDAPAPASPPPTISPPAVAAKGTPPSTPQSRGSSPPTPAAPAQHASTPPAHTAAAATATPPPKPPAPSSGILDTSN